MIYRSKLQKLKKIDHLLENQIAKQNETINKSKQNILPTDKLIINSKLLLTGTTLKRNKKNPVEEYIEKRQSFTHPANVISNPNLNKRILEFRQSKNKWKILFPWR